jgi:hypothetical protein
MAARGGSLDARGEHVGLFKRGGRWTGGSHTSRHCTFAARGTTWGCAQTEYGSTVLCWAAEVGAVCVDAWRERGGGEGRFSAGGSHRAWTDGRWPASACGPSRAAAWSTWSAGIDVVACTRSRHRNQSE